jgi:hypothetical protein
VQVHNAIAIKGLQIQAVNYQGFLFVYIQTTPEHGYTHIAHKAQNLADGSQHPPALDHHEYNKMTCLYYVWDSASYSHHVQLKLFDSTYSHEDGKPPLNFIDCWSIHHPLNFWCRLTGHAVQRVQVRCSSGNMHPDKVHTGYKNSLA